MSDGAGAGRAYGCSGTAGFAGVQGLPGSVGPPGETGRREPQGIPGQAGAQGLTGPAGAQGLSGPMGPQGPAGPVGMTFQGTYSSTVNYAEGDGVMFNGSAYVSLVASNHGNTPDQSPAWWGLFATGSPGATGPAGLGPQGLPGAPGAAEPRVRRGRRGRLVRRDQRWRTIRGTTLRRRTMRCMMRSAMRGRPGCRWLRGMWGIAPDQSPAQWAVLAAQGPAGPLGCRGPLARLVPTGAAGALGPAGPRDLRRVFRGRGWWGVLMRSGVLWDSADQVMCDCGKCGERAGSESYVLGGAGAGGDAGDAGSNGPQGPAGAPGAVGVTFAGPGWADGLSRE